MPISPRQRASDRTNLLILLVENVGDDPLHNKAFYPWQSEFEAFAATTWPELVERGLIEDRGEKPGPSYRLTPDGWLTGLEWSGALKRQDTRDRAISIRALKARIAGRQLPYDVPVPEEDGVRCLVLSPSTFPS